MMVRDLFNQFHTVFDNKQENAVNDASSIGLYSILHLIIYVFCQNNSVFHLRGLPHIKRA